MARKRYTHIGGQAVIEGVMMRGKRHWTVTVRRPDGTLAQKSQPIKTATDRYPVLKWPIIRGTVALWETLSLSMMALTYSMNESTEGEEVQLSRGEMGLSMMLGVVLAVGIFIVVPAIATNLLVHWIGRGVWWNLVDGLIRIAIFFVYLWAVGRIPDIKRVFEYHGAEHKTIHAYEDGVELEPASIEAFSTSHVRCGTSFLLVVMVVAILVFSFLGQQTLLWRILIRILLLPVIAGISYEVIKFAGEHDDLAIVRLIMLPGLALQAMTTREPSDDQIEVAIASLREVIRIEGDELAGAAAADGPQAQGAELTT